MPERLFATLTLYGRVYCHLCDDMERALLALQPELGFRLDCVDVDADPGLEDRFGERVPVLTLGDRELCHYFVDEAAVRAALAADLTNSAAAPLPPESRA